MNAHLNARYEFLDCLRGFAVLWMTIFHFCFDLSYFGWWQQKFTIDPFWVLQRSAIVSLFLFCAGFGQALAHSQNLSWTRFVRRWREVVLCAMLVSLGSWLMFPKSFIYFGVLHALVLMLLMSKCITFWRVSSWVLLIGAVLLIGVHWAFWLIQPSGEIMHLLNSQNLNWLGLITQKPITQDYVPIFPWFAAVLMGIIAGRHLLSKRDSYLFNSKNQQNNQNLNSQKPFYFLNFLNRSLIWLGKNSLAWYMLHQVVLIGFMRVIVWMQRSI